MIIARRFPTWFLLWISIPLVALELVWTLIVLALYVFAGWHFLQQPFLPISTIGTAVAFYVGFKNNSAYDRFWEGRKIWGGIVNTSRSWAAAVLAHVGGGERTPEVQAMQRELLYRQLAWINALRLQLRRTSRFFDKPSWYTRRRLQRHGEAMRNDWDGELAPFLSPDELAEVSPMANPATHLLHRQSQQLSALLASKHLNLFHQLALMELVTELYTLQGKCERIKNTPFPRQYAEYSRLFTRVFVLLVPLGLLDVFGVQVENAVGFWNTVIETLPMIVASGLIGWIFTTMEGVGDSSEDPFERSLNDVPMNAICRAIEIDVRQLLGETDVPAPEKPAGWVLY